MEKFYSQADVAGIIGPAYALASEGVDLEGVGEVLDEIREVRTDFWFNKLNPEYDETGPTLTG